MTEPASRGRSGRARTAGVVLAWLVAVAVATVVGMVAVGAIGSGIVSSGERPLSADEVNRRLAQPSGTAPSAGPGTAASTSTPPATPASQGQPSAATSPPGGPTRVFGTAGGTVIARCAPGVEVVSATPAQGYRVEDIEPEDGGQRVRFESGETGVEIRLTCAGGEPQSSVRTG